MNADGYRAEADAALLDAARASRTLLQLAEHAEGEALKFRTLRCGHAIAAEITSLAAALVGQPVGTVPCAVHDLGALQINAETRTVAVDGRAVDLTPKEMELLLALAAHPVNVISRDDLVSLIWGPNAVRVASRSLDTHAQRLRSKLGPTYIKNHWGIGYQLLSPAEASA